MYRFRTSFTIVDNVHLHTCRTVRTKGAIATVKYSIEEDENGSIRHLVQQLVLCLTTLWKILRKNFGLQT